MYFRKEPGACLGCYKIIFLYLCQNCKYFTDPLYLALTLWFVTKLVLRFGKLQSRAVHIRFCNICVKCRLGPEYGHLVFFMRLSSSALQPSWSTYFEKQPFRALQVSLCNIWVEFSQCLQSPAFGLVPLIFGLLVQFFGKRGPPGVWRCYHVLHGSPAVENGGPCGSQFLNYSHDRSTFSGMRSSWSLNVSTSPWHAHWLAALCARTALSPTRNYLLQVWRMPNCAHTNFAVTQAQLIGWGRTLRASPMPSIISLDRWTAFCVWSLSQFLLFYNIGGKLIALVQKLK